MCGREKQLILHSLETDTRRYIMKIHGGGSRVWDHLLDIPSLSLNLMGTEDTVSRYRPNQ